MSDVIEYQHIETLRRQPRVNDRQYRVATDSELMERIQSRDERALETLIKRFQALVRSVVERIIPNNQDVSDVVEEVFLSVWNQAANFDSLKGNPIRWIITIARRALLIVSAGARLTTAPRCASESRLKPKRAILPEMTWRRRR